MSADGDVDTSREVVKIYVPAFQKDEWADHADELEMSLSEFVRSMVQAGRRGFTGTTTDGDEQRDQGGDGAELESRVVAALRERDCLSWEELLAEVTDDVEASLDETLQQSDRIRYSGRDGGYVLEVN